MVGSYSLIYRYLKAQIGMQVVRNFEVKKRSLLGINEHFLAKNYEQDAPNMGFL